jgi:uncharacterized BrkB/YihY/UPF0761 family membrane protein
MFIHLLICLTWLPLLVSGFMLVTHNLHNLNAHQIDDLNEFKFPMGWMVSFIMCLLFLMYLYSIVNKT